MEVRKDFKTTDVGAIPNDWDVKKIGEITDATAGGTPSTLVAEYWGGNIKWMSSGELHSKYVYDVEGRITEDGFKNSSTKILPPKCILIGLAGQGKTRGTVAINMIELCTNQSIAAIFPSRHFIPEYLFYNLDTRYTELRSLSTGDGGRGGLNLGIIKSLFIPLPPIQEQQAIATALSDVDALLAALDALIAKKRLVKQGAMQELLMGRKRLLGYNGEWLVKKLGDVSDIKTGKKNNEEKVDGGIYPFFVRSQTVEQINTYSFDGEAILVPGEGGIGSIFHYINGKFDYHQRVYKISDFTAGTCGKFIYFVMVQHFNRQAMRTTVKATVDSLRLPTFLEFEFLAPPTLAEQTAIAEILSDMDAEITALEARREKTRLLKQGMMQELLTGRIRLV